MGLCLFKWQLKKSAHIVLLDLFAENKRKNASVLFTHDFTCPKGAMSIT